MIDGKISITYCNRMRYAASFSFLGPILVLCSSSLVAAQTQTTASSESSIYFTEEVCNIAMQDQSMAAFGYPVLSTLTSESQALQLLADYHLLSNQEFTQAVTRMIEKRFQVSNTRTSDKPSFKTLRSIVKSVEAVRRLTLSETRSFIDDILQEYLAFFGPAPSDLHRVHFEQIQTLKAALLQLPAGNPVERAFMNYIRYAMSEWAIQSARNLPRKEETLLSLFISPPMLPFASLFVGSILTSVSGLISLCTEWTESWWRAHYIDIGIGTSLATAGAGIFSHLYDWGSRAAFQRSVRTLPSVPSSYQEAISRLSTELGAEPRSPSNFEPDQTDSFTTLSLGDVAQTGQVSHMNPVQISALGKAELTQLSQRVRQLLSRFPMGTNPEDAAQRAIFAASILLAKPEDYDNRVEFRAALKSLAFFSPRNASSRQAAADLAALKEEIQRCITYAEKLQRLASDVKPIPESAYLSNRMAQTLKGLEELTAQLAPKNAAEGAFVQHDRLMQIRKNLDEAGTDWVEQAKNLLDLFGFAP